MATTILNTRPQAQLQHTHEVFAGKGFAVIDFPCIEIVTTTDNKSAIQQLTDISIEDVIVFTSQYAVHHAYRLNPQTNITSQNCVIAIGNKTAEVLEQNYSGHIWVPEHQHSEGTIELIKGLAQCQSIKLITGENGRNAIQAYAQTKHITFEQINVYKRQLPIINNDALKKIQQCEDLLILATSVTTLKHLRQLLKHIWQDMLLHTVLCASSRIEHAAYQMGFKTTLNSHSANPEKMAAHLIDPQS
jgi:uroporphyrinogen-III synthase